MPIPAIIPLLVLAAASIAGSEISASQRKGQAKDEATRRKNEALRQARTDYYMRKAQDAGNSIGMLTRSDALGPWLQRAGIENGYEGAMRAANADADAIRTQGYINAAGNVASGIAGGALTSGWGGGDAANALRGQAADYVARGSQMNLDPNNSMLLSEQGSYRPAPMYRSTDPNGGFQLQSQDYRLLSGDADWNDPNAYRFRL